MDKAQKVNDKQIYQNEVKKLLEDRNKKERNNNTPLENVLAVNNRIKIENMKLREKNNDLSSRLLSQIVKFPCNLRVIIMKMKLKCSNLTST